MDNINEKLSGDRKKVIKVLMVLLILSLLCLTGRYIYLNYMRADSSSITVISEKVNGEADTAGKIVKIQRENHTIPDDTSIVSGNDNQGFPEKKLRYERVDASFIELDWNQPEYNEKFEVFGMLPGDTVTKYYCVKVYHDYDVKVYFETDVTYETKQLGDVLKVKVTDVSGESGEETLVAEGAWNEIDGKSYPLQLKENQDDCTTKYYKIDVSLDTSVGNSYQESELSANFKWYVKDEEHDAMQEDKPIIPGITEPEKADVPKTGDMFDKSLWVIFIGSVLLLFMNVAVKRK